VPGDIAMRKIEAIIRHVKLDEVKDALQDIDVTGMTVTEVLGFGRQKGHTGVYRGNEYSVDFVSKIKIEIIVENRILEDAVEAVKASARTGKIGDGKIFVSSVENAYRIRTGQTGTEAL